MVEWTSGQQCFIKTISFSPVHFELRNQLGNTEEESDLMPLGTAIAFNVPGLYWHLERLDFIRGSQLSIAVTKRRGGGLTGAPEVSQLCGSII